MNKAQYGDIDENAVYAVSQNPFDLLIKCLDDLRYSGRILGMDKDPKDIAFTTSVANTMEDTSDTSKALSILYRLVRGQSIIGMPDGTDAKPTLNDALDLHSNVRTLKTMIITFGQRWHMAALYNADSASYKVTQQAAAFAQQPKLDPTESEKVLRTTCSPNKTQNEEEIYESRSRPSNLDLTGLPPGVADDTVQESLKKGPFDARVAEVDDGNNHLAGLKKSLDEALMHSSNISIKDNTLWRPVVIGAEGEDEEDDLEFHKQTTSGSSVWISEHRTSSHALSNIRRSNSFDRLATVSEPLISAQQSNPTVAEQHIIIENIPTDEQATFFIRARTPGVPQANMERLDPPHTVENFIENPIFETVAFADKKMAEPRRFSHFDEAFKTIMPMTKRFVADGIRSASMDIKTEKVSPAAAARAATTDELRKLSDRGHVQMRDPTAQTTPISNTVKNISTLTESYENLKLKDTMSQTTPSVSSRLEDVSESIREMKTQEVPKWLLRRMEIENTALISQPSTPLTQRAKLTDPAEKGVSLATKEAVPLSPIEQTVLDPAEQSNRRTGFDGAMSLDELHNEALAENKLDLDAFLSGSKSNPLNFTHDHIHLDISPAKEATQENKGTFFFANIQNTPTSNDNRKHSIRDVGSAFDRQWKSSPSVKFTPETPQQQSNRPIQAMYTGASALANTTIDGQESGKPGTSGSPQSFAWTASELGSPPNKIMEHTPNPKGGIASKTTTPSVGSAFLSATTPSYQTQNSAHMSSMVKPKIRSALEFVLRHLVFSHNQNSVLTEINYWKLYGTGMNFGSMTNLSGLPALGTVEMRKMNSDLEEEFEVPLNEPLHPMLRSAFRLDMNLMVEYFSSLTMGKMASLACKSRHVTAHEKLKGWLSGLAEVHQYLLPASRALFHLDRQLSSPLSIAQAMVLIQDQISLLKRTQGDSGHVNSTLKIDDNAPFMEWVNAVL
ncbi:hypothetical protein HDV05_008036 [Chytridiales sp. JEL 0842]|nr:hypothetical protein HDV05_008036 [Chytridiales sp. JEL 0842]